VIGAPPPASGSRLAVAAPFEAVLAPLRRALERCGARGPFASVGWGRPEPDDGQWLDLDGFGGPSGGAAAIRRLTPAGGDPANLIGHWVFQNAAGTPPLLAGYLFAAQRRVPALEGNTLLHDSQWLQHLRLVEPRLTVLAEDPLAGLAGVTVVADQAALTAALFDEIERTYGPIVQGFRARRLVSTANAWASVVDGLLQGYLLAGTSGLGLDVAWELWRATTSGWPVATRRWPRRLEFDRDGFRDEVVVRAACCLVFTSVDSSGAKVPNCPNCPLDIGDEGRIRWMVDWLRQVEGEAGVGRGSAGVVQAGG
jgi:hypothetical protein